MLHLSNAVVANPHDAADSSQPTVCASLANIGDNKTEDTSSRRSSFATSTTSYQSCQSHGRSSLTGSIPNAEIKSRIRVSHAESSRNSVSKQQTFTMNKLHFSSLGLHGRKKEMEELQVCFDRLAAASELVKLEGNETRNDQIMNPNEVVFISGESGTGKVS